MDTQNKSGIKIIAERLEINYWLHYVKRYLEINSLEPTSSEVRKALNDHDKTLSIRLKKCPNDLINKLTEMLKVKKG